MNVLANENRLLIIKFITESKEGVSASEIAEKLNLKISTVMSHLEQMESVGLIRFDWKRIGRGRPLKKYKLVDNYVTIDLDLAALARIPNKEELEEKIFTYISLKRKRDTLPVSLTVEDIIKTLNVDAKTALVLLDYLTEKKNEVAKMLASEVLEKFKNKKVVEIEKIARELKVHEYWAAKTASYLESKGLYKVREGKICRIEYEKGKEKTGK